jgi:hypothetical protein
MRKRIACVTAAILSISLGVSGCGLIPFEQDIPFLSSIAENAETEKKQNSRQLMNRMLIQRKVQKIHSRMMV